MTETPLTRRRVLRLVGGGCGGVALAGCGDGTAPTTTPESTGDDPTTTEEDGVTPTEPADELDLREANVIGVAVEATNGSYRFDVTLHHDDHGEPGYANWWQVERLDGTRLGRRELLHAHSEQPFTRSETVDVPADVDCIVVRGHDETHGYGGQVMLVDLASGTTRAVQGGSERQTVAAGDCP